MSKVDKKLEYFRLEKYLTGQFHFRVNEITGAIEFKKRFDGIRSMNPILAMQIKPSNFAVADFYNC